MKLSKKINEINAIVFQANKFTFYEHDFGEWFPIYVDTGNYRRSKTIYSTYFSHVYCELLYDFSKALNLTYLFTLSSVEFDLSNDIFLGEKTKKIRNKNSTIRLSAYLQHIVKTFEDNESDIFCPNSVHAIFDYDDISVIETVRSVLLEFLIKSSNVGASENLKIYEKNTKHTLKLLKKRNKIEKQDKIDFSSNEVQNLEIDMDLVTVEQTMEILGKVSRGTIRNWTDKGFLIKYAIGGRVYYKRSELLNASTELK
tara:strand:- start:297 stop:1064 length:768 start_codon:yes stop_codon:yes gene_type:complete